MRLTRVFKPKKYGYLYFLMITFLILKMMRGMGEVSSSGGIWNIIQVLYILIGIYFYRLYKHNESCINTFFLYAIITMAVSFFNMPLMPIESATSWFYYFMIPYPAFVLFIFYVIGFNGGIRNYRFWIHLTFYVLILLFCRTVSVYQMNEIDEETIILVADIYYPLGLLPFILATTKNSRAIIPLILMFVGVIISGKRGGLIAITISSILFFLIGLNNHKRKTKLFIQMFSLIISVAAIVYLVPYIDSIIGTNTVGKMSQIEQDGGSGRAWRWTIIEDAVAGAGIFEILFGHGFDAVYSLVGGRAHNDFLELLYNYGMLSFLFYIVFYVNLIYLNLKMYKSHYLYSKFFTCSIVISLVLSLVSCYVVEPTYITCGMFCTGLFIGDWRRIEIKKRYNR